MYRTIVHRGRKGERKSFSETDYIELIDAAHQRLSAPLVVIWDNLNVHISAAMRALIDARDWLTDSATGLRARPESGRKRLVERQKRARESRHPNPRRPAPRHPQSAQTHPVPTRTHRRIPRPDRTHPRRHDLTSAIQPLVTTVDCCLSAFAGFRFPAELIVVARLSQVPFVGPYNGPLRGPAAPPRPTHSACSWSSPGSSAHTSSSWRRWAASSSALASRHGLPRPKVPPTAPASARRRPVQGCRGARCEDQVCGGRLLGLPGAVAGVQGCG
jgi:hypothetical protein